MNSTICRASAGLVVFVFYAFLMVPGLLAAGSPSYGMPSTVDPSAKYLFFFHNYYVETKGPDADCKYYEILKAFSDKGFTVISEIRPKDASVDEYAKTATANIETLLKAGVPQENITVAGHSKGAVITLQVATRLNKQKIGYLVLAGCGIKGLEKVYPDFSRLNGNILSLLAISDDVAGSCNSAFFKSKRGLTHEEIVLDSAEGHKLFFTPDEVWLSPVLGWLEQKKRI
jgi:hypothetical protein